MIRSFLALVPLVVLPAVAVAQIPASPYSFAGGTCPGGQCSRVQAAVQAVRSAGADALESVAGLVRGPVFGGQPPVPLSGPVRGVYADGSRSWGPVPQAIPQVMLGPCPPGGCSQPVPHQWRPFGGRFR